MSASHPPHVFPSVGPVSSRCCVFATQTPYPIFKNIMSPSSPDCPESPVFPPHRHKKKPHPKVRLFVIRSWRCPTLTWGDPTLPSALNVFTSEFEMGSGGSRSLLPPGKPVRKIGYPVPYFLNKSTIWKISDASCRITCHVQNALALYDQAARAISTG